MSKWEVTLWPNNQPPILIGYYEADCSMDAKIKAAEEMTADGCQLSPNDENLSAVRKSDDTGYQRWITPPIEKYKNEKRNNNRRIRPRIC